MKVEIMKEEHVDLLDLLHIASWVLVSHKTTVDPRVEKFEMIIQKLYTLAREMGRGDLVEYDPGRGDTVRQRCLKIYPLPWNSSRSSSTIRSGTN
jgi:hypothetical protein